MRKFILPDAGLDESVFKIIRRLESGELRPADVPDDMNYCIELNGRHWKCPCNEDFLSGELRRPAGLVEKRMLTSR